MEKKCFKCQLIKPLTDFYRHKGNTDGYLGKCKDCTRRDVNARYRDPSARQKIRAYEVKRFNNAKRREKLKEYARKMSALNPLKRQARGKLWTALKNGTIKRCPCEKCGADKSQAHHTDYTQPLLVNWLCFKHHREAHGQLVNSF